MRPYTIREYRVFQQSVPERRDGSIEVETKKGTKTLPAYHAAVTLVGQIQAYSGDDAIKVAKSQLGISHALVQRIGHKGSRVNSEGI